MGSFHFPFISFISFFCSPKHNIDRWMFAESDPGLESIHSSGLVFHGSALLCSGLHLFLPRHTHLRSRSVDHRKISESIHSFLIFIRMLPLLPFPLLSGGYITSHSLLRSNHRPAFPSLSSFLLLGYVPNSSGPTLTVWNHVLRKEVPEDIQIPLGASAIHHQRQTLFTGSNPQDSFRTVELGEVQEHFVGEQKEEEEEVSLLPGKDSGMNFLGSPEQRLCAALLNGASGRDGVCVTCRILRPIRTRVSRCIY